MEIENKLTTTFFINKPLSLSKKDKTKQKMAMNVPTMTINWHMYSEIDKTFFTDDSLS